MAEIEKSIVVNAPLREVYNQWTQFEDFPRFMEGVEEVHQIDDRRLHWRARVAGKDQEWEAEIVDQVPDRRIAWRATTGAENAGAVLFEPVGDSRTKVTLRLKYQPEGATEKIGELLGSMPVRLSVTAILPSHALSSTWFFASNASPVGPSQPSGQVATSACVIVSTTARAPL